MKTIYELEHKGTRTLHATMPTLLGYLFNVEDYSEVLACETAFYVGSVAANKQNITLKRGEVVMATIKARVGRP